MELNNFKLEILIRNINYKTSKKYCKVALEFTLILSNLGILWPFLLCSIYLVQAIEDDLLDFDFGNLKEIDWTMTDNMPSTKLPNQQQQELIARNKQLYDNKNDDNKATKENQVNHGIFDWHERILRKALAKVLTNKTQRQNFLEILPILRVLSKQQKLALSALISAQINAKNGQELKLDQVRRMFGDDKKLLIPIVYDIANLVRNSAKKYMIYNFDMSDDLVDFSKRNVKLSSIELDEENQNVGISSLPSESMEFHNHNDSMKDLISLQHSTDSVLDAISINEQIQSMYMKPEMIESDKKQISDGNKLRLKRSTESEQLVHKLIRAIPSSVNEEDLLKATNGRSLKLNTTIFSTSKESQNYASDDIKEGVKENGTIKTLAASISPSSIKPIEAYQFIEDLALASLNETRAWDTDTDYGNANDENVDFKNTGDKDKNMDKDAEDYNNDEKLPTPEELISKPRLRIRKIISPIASKILSNKRKRISTRVKSKQDNKLSVPPPRNCERFTSSICIKTEDYPLKQIMSSIRRHRNAMVALLAEYNDKWNSIEANYEFNENTFNKKRREDESSVSGNGMCQSTVRYARPQKARSAAGEWKYIINTDQHTQTLRLEKCTSPQESCSYLNQHYRSHCAQVYNYHRLLSWDKNRGLHVDIFKVPTCCSCQVDGYRSKFTPFTDPKKQYTSIYNEDPYQKDIDYNDDVVEDDNDDDDNNFDLDYLKHGSSAFDSKELVLDSKKIRKKIAKPTVGSYLSPPGKEFREHNTYIHGYESQSDVTSTIANPSLSLSNSINFLKDLTRRRPFKGYKEARADQEYSPSETEVKKFGTNFAMDDSIHQKRKNIYSVPYIANTGSNNGNTGNNSWLPSNGPATITANTGSLHTFTPSSPITNPIYQYRLNTNAHKTLPTKHTRTITGIATTNEAKTRGSATASIRRNTAFLPVDYKKTRTNRTHVRLSNGQLAEYKRTAKIPYTIAPTLITNKTANISSIEAATTAATVASTSTSSSATTAKTATAITSININKTNKTEQFKATSEQSNLFSINPELYNFHNRHKHNIIDSLGETINTSTNNTMPKRINYNYHPIIDFFEYNYLDYNTSKIASSNNHTNNMQYKIYEKPLLTTTQIKSKNSIHNKIPNNTQNYYTFRFPKGELSKNKKLNHTIRNFGHRYRYRFGTDDSDIGESNVSILINNNQPIKTATTMNSSNRGKTEVINKWQPVRVDPKA